MKRNQKFLLVLCLAIALAFSAAGCGSNTGSTDKDDGQKVKIFSGKLTDALAEKIVVKNDDDMLEFKTDKKTVYELGEEKELIVGDTVKVEYRTEEADKIAERVTVTKVREVDLFFEGLVTDVNDTDITVAGKNLTVRFQKDKKSAVTGKLSKGDSVRVDYTGDISKSPYAKTIKVTKEKKNLKTYTVDGIVSQLTKDSLLLSIQSSNSHRFKLSQKTKITGKSKKLKVGYMVRVTYKGDIDKEPAAVKINVNKIPKARVFVIDGTVSKVSNGSFILKAGSRSYRFTTDKNTKYTGKTLNKGVAATVSYMGRLQDGAKAVGVYCTAAKTDKSKKKASKKAKVKKAKKASPASNQQNEQQEENPSPAPGPEPSTEPEPQADQVSDQGTVDDPTVTVYCSITDVNDKFCNVKDENGNVLKLYIAKDAKIASGYMPQIEDHVKVVYDKDKMWLMSIQLLYRPQSNGPDDNVAAAKTAPMSSQGSGSGESGDGEGNSE